MSFDSGAGSPPAAEAPHVTFSAASGVKRLYLAPGHVFAARDAVQITTILGSCVAVCLWDAGVLVGGMNHFLLPEGLPHSPRFADVAMPRLLSEVVALGGERARLTAKLFGGASVLEAFRASSTLGARNVETARGWLGAQRIPVVEEHVGGELGRRVAFDLRNGGVRVRVIAGSA